MDTQQRTCRTCGPEQPITEYYKPGRKSEKDPDQRHHECTTCTKERLKESHCPETYRRQHLQRSYGITPEQYSELLEKQKHKCAACHTTEPGGKHNIFVVDHSHATGRVRGLLCKDCNIALGLLKDNTDTIANLIRYLA